jgi:hypothetical protein
VWAETFDLLDEMRLRSNFRPSGSCLRRTIRYHDYLQDRAFQEGTQSLQISAREAADISYAGTAPEFAIEDPRKLSLDQSG